ncbi:YopX family protein [Staphylococcus simulans]|uniref:YopX family protein n=1 Tax=Staphylococcus simulans TaxID=1286 RepID=UPI000D02C8C2|nr:YopX family protein [Staphylococcus simulans]
MQKAISKETGKWIYGTYFDGFMLRGKVIEATEEYITIEEWHPVITETLCNATGTYDMLGNEVYENDIIESEYRMHESYQFTVKRTSIQNACYAYTPYRPNTPHQLGHILTHAKIIGNATKEELK